MIYEMKTYDLKARATKEVEKRFGEAYEHRKKYSEIAAFWHTEIGRVDQITYLWAYESLEERARIRAAAAKSGNWPPDIGEFIVRGHSDILIPFAASPKIVPAKVGPFFEMRTYTYTPGGLPALMDVWNRSLEWRLQYGPVVGLFHTDIGDANKFIHIWPYASLDLRFEIREKAIAPGKWPPHQKSVKEGTGGYDLVSREIKIMKPAAFSPLQ